MTDNAAYLNALGTATPAHEVHRLFTAYAPRLLQTRRELRLFERMVQRCGIERRYSVLGPGRDGALDDAGLYRAGAFADTTTAALVRFRKVAVICASPSDTTRTIPPVTVAIAGLLDAHCACEVTSLTAPLPNVADAVS